MANNSIREGECRLFMGSGGGGYLVVALLKGHVTWQ